MPYYSSAEVVQHNVSSDCWVSYFGKVYDLTELVRENKGLLVQPILKFAGQDISSWFDSISKDPKTCMDEKLGVQVPFCPHGRYVHIPPADATMADAVDTPWWRETKYEVGKLSSQSRLIKIVNVHTEQEEDLAVCAEETLEEIRTRFLKYNAHALSYTWKRLGRPLDMTKTLEENGVKDESEEFADLNMDGSKYTSAIHIYFNDDLTVR